MILPLLQVRSLVMMPIPHVTEQGLEDHSDQAGISKSGKFFNVHVRNLGSTQLACTNAHASFLERGYSKKKKKKKKERKVCNHEVNSNMILNQCRFVEFSDNLILIKERKCFSEVS